MELARGGRVASAPFRQGQVCTCNERMYAHGRHHDAFPNFQERVQELKIAIRWPTKTSTWGRG